MPSSEVEEYVNENINSARLSLEGCPNNVVYGVALRRIIRQAFQAGRKSFGSDEIERIQKLVDQWAPKQTTEAGIKPVKLDDWPKNQTVNLQG